MEGTNWWTGAVFYEIYMPSFCDGNGDGIGDFKGITSKLDYLAELGVDAIWLTPYYVSPKVDNGYDIEDYYNVDPDYGTMNDFEDFITRAHEKGLKVIIDLVLNHTSSAHNWFLQSKSSKKNPKRDWYIWKDGTGSGPPNNWESFFGGSAWEYDEQTGQYYYHAFAKEQADLNWSNPEVKQALFEVMRFWLEKGIDGFRLDVINFLTVDRTFRNNPKDQNGEQIHLYDKDQDGILEILKEINSFVKQYDDRFLLGEVGSEDLAVLNQYLEPGLMDAVFNFNLGSMAELDSDELFLQLKKMDEQLGSNELPTLFFSSHDMSRHISRFGRPEEVIAKLMSTLILTAKGIPFIYYGDEIGIRDFCAGDITEMKDIQGLTVYKLALEEGKGEEEALEKANQSSRDKSRTPMLWNDEKYSGFSTSDPWISLSLEKTKNVSAQFSDPSSLLCYYKSLLQLRKQLPALMNGSYKRLNKKGDVIFYTKEANNQEVHVALNFSSAPQSFSDIKLSEVELVISSKRDKLDSDKGALLNLLPFEALVFTQRG
ncbi:alpha-glucosidase [Alteribacter keqinensis]|nr:alpha-glucosidase [Alteribacter keqinensis]